MKEEKPFWQNFALRILWLIGVKPDEVEKVVITIEAGKVPTITVHRHFFENGEVKQVLDVFEATDWKKV